MLLKFGDFYPHVGNPIFVAPGSYVIGRVTLGDYVSVWFNAVIRADSEMIRVASGSNIQDNVTMHADLGFPCEVGENVTIGHNAVVHGAYIDDDVLIGMGSVVMNGAKINRNVLIAAGSLIPEGMEIPEGMLAMGRPCRIVRTLEQKEREAIAHAASHYRDLWIQAGWHFR
ncbi:MAG: gamma carbonic anhydrase family protein [Firmicutes bacterium]|nr:gamma carbonic anhydrase family protein [Bacillota bacterium]